MQHKTYYSPIEHGIKHKGNITVRELLELRQSRLRTNTRKSNLSLVHHIEDYSRTRLPVREVDSNFCIGFGAYLVERVKANSARTYLQKFHALLQDAVRMGVLRTNPMPPIGELLPRYATPERPFLTVSEIRRLEVSPCPHENTKQAFLFACHTGLRLSDIETLRWADLRKCNGRQMIVKIQVKTGREVRIPIDCYAQEILSNQPGTSNKDGHIFDLHSRTIIAKDLRQWGDAAYIGKHVTFHVARHTFATLMISQGISIYAVSQLCGHTDVKTTQIYASLIDPARFTAIESLDDLFGYTKNVEPHAW